MLKISNDQRFPVPESEPEMQAEAMRRLGELAEPQAMRRLGEWIDANRAWMKGLIACAEDWYRGEAAGSRPTLEGGDGRRDLTHDEHHLERGWTMALRLAAIEAVLRGVEVNFRIVFAAMVGHDLVVRNKTDPAKERDTRESAEAIGHILHRIWVMPLALDDPQRPVLLEEIEMVKGMVRRCSVSLNLPPECGLEEDCVRDADLLECFGPVGLMRFGAASADMGRPFAPLEDPAATGREPDGWRYLTDAVVRRGVRKANLLRTESAKRIAAPRLAFLEAFLASTAADLAPLAQVRRLLDPV